MKAELFNLMAFLTLYIVSLPAISDTECSIYKNKTLDAHVINVADGDTATVKILPKGRKIKVRFYGVDTPESEWKGVWPAQPFSQESTNFTSSKLRNNTVQIRFNGQATYSRCVGEIYVNGKSHSLALIERGYGWWYSKYAPNRTDLELAQNKARQDKTGLWNANNPQAPWAFRRKD